MGDTDAAFRKVLGRGRFDTAQIKPIDAKHFREQSSRAQSLIQHIVSRPTTTSGRMPKVNFDFIDDGRLNAVAFHDDGEDYIGIDHGTLLLINDLFTRELSHPLVLPWVGCTDGEERDRTYITGPPIVEGRFPGVRSHDLEQLTALPRDPVRGMYAAQLSQHAIDFLVLHEIHHLRNGHVGFMSDLCGELRISEVSDTRKQPISALTRQTLEFDADALATCDGVRFALAPRDAMAAEYSRVLGTPSLMLRSWYFAVLSLFCLFASQSHEFDADQSSHPPPTIRYHMIGATACEFVHERCGPDAERMLASFCGQAAVEAAKAFALVSRTDFDKESFVSAVATAGEYGRRYRGEWKRIHSQLSLHARTILVPPSDEVG